MQNKVVLKINRFGLCKKCMVSMATGNAILKKGVRPTKSIISQLLLILDIKRWYQIKA